MAHDFTNLCIDTLIKELRGQAPNYDWTIEGGISNEKERIDILGEDSQSKVMIEVEVHNSLPMDNVIKLFKLQIKQKILIIQIFSPFYEVSPHFELAESCEQLAPLVFQRNGQAYLSYRWELDTMKTVRKACQVLPKSHNEFPPMPDIKNAIAILANNVIALMRKWEKGCCSANPSN